MPSQSQKPTVLRKYRRFCQADLEAVAELVAGKLTETESCAILGINYASFRTWKNKVGSSQRFNDAFVRIRGEKLRAHIASIERAGLIGHDSKRGPDWRASAWLLTVQDRERFSEREPAIQVNVAAVPEDRLQRALARTYGRTQEALPSRPVRQLESKAGASSGQGDGGTGAGQDASSDSVIDIVP